MLSILGLAGVVGLAVGFAFRDITENFIASVLLGMRRPFQIGDYVTVAGQSGVVKSLNTRATVLVTLEGKHVRIPNSVIFKEIMVNSTASPSFRNSFDVTIPTRRTTDGPRGDRPGPWPAQEGILTDPPPRALVEALEPGGVRLRAYFWTPTHGVDWFQLTSDAKLNAKLALQAAGILPVATNHVAGIPERPAGKSRRVASGEPVDHPARPVHNDPNRSAALETSPYLERQRSPGPARARPAAARVTGERGGYEPAEGREVGVGGGLGVRLTRRSVGGKNSAIRSSIIRRQLGDVGRLVPLGVEVIGVELADPVASIGGRARSSAGCTAPSRCAG